MKIFRKKRSRRGFTLIELLAATAIMIVLVMFVTTIAVNMMRIYDKTIATLSTSSDAATVLDPLQEDFLSASMPDDGNYWFEMRCENDVDNLDKKSAPEFFFYARPQDRIRREASSKTNLPGELCAVSYKIAHQSPFGSKVSNSAGNFVYGFYRAVLNAQDTFDLALPYSVGQKGTAAASRIPSRFWKSGEQITDPSDRKTYSAGDWRTETQNFLVNDVVNFSVFFWFDDFSDGKRKIAALNDSALVSRLRSMFPDTTVETFQKSLVASAGTLVLDENFDSPTRGSLRSAEVSITVLTPEGKERLLALQSQANTGKIDSEKFSEILLEYGETFSRTCQLFGGR